MLSFIKAVVFVVIFVTLLILNYHVWQKYQKQEERAQALEKQLQSQYQKNAALSNTNQELKFKIETLKQGSNDMIEEEARKDFGMIGKDETYYSIEDQEVDPEKAQ